MSFKLCFGYCIIFNLENKGKILGIGGVNPEEMMKGLIASRMRIEFADYKLVGDLITFREKWCIGEMLCSIYEEQHFNLVVLNN